MRGVSRSTLRQHDGVQRWVGRAVMPAQGEPRAHAARRTQRAQLAQSAVIRNRILDIAESLAQIEEKYVRSNFIRCRFLALFGPRSVMSTSPNILPGSNGSASGLFLSLRSKRPGGRCTPDVQPLLDQHEPSRHHRSVPSDDRNVGNLPMRLSLAFVPHVRALLGDEL
jgi:hypothetical protein